MGTVTTSEVAAALPTLKEIKKSLGPMSMLITEKTLQGFNGAKPFDLFDRHGQLRFRITVLKLSL